MERYSFFPASHIVFHHWLIYSENLNWPEQNRNINQIVHTFKSQAQFELLVIIISTDSKHKLSVVRYELLDFYFLDTFWLIFPTTDSLNTLQAGSGLILSLTLYYSSMPPTTVHCRFKSLTVEFPVPNLVFIRDTDYHSINRNLMVNNGKWQKY